MGSTVVLAEGGGNATRWVVRPALSGTWERICREKTDLLAVRLPASPHHSSRCSRSYIESFCEGVDGALYSLCPGVVSEGPPHNPACGRLRDR